LFHRVAGFVNLLSNKYQLSSVFFILRLRIVNAKYEKFSNNDMFCAQDREKRDQRCSPIAFESSSNTNSTSQSLQKSGVRCEYSATPESSFAYLEGEKLRDHVKLSSVFECTNISEVSAFFSPEKHNLTDPWGRLMYRITCTNIVKHTFLWYSLNFLFSLPSYVVVMCQRPY